MRAIPAVVVGYAISCAATAMGLLASAEMGFIPPGENEIWLRGMEGFPNLYLALVIFALPGFLLLRGMLYVTGVANIFIFAVAGAANAALVEASTWGVVESPWLATAVLGLIAGAVQWWAERFVRAAPIVLVQGVI